MVVSTSSSGRQAISFQVETMNSRSMAINDGQGCFRSIHPNAMISNPKALGGMISFLHITSVWEFFG